MRLSAAARRTALAAALSAAVATTVCGSGSRPAAADPLPSCTTASGVVDAVDLRPWGGAVSRGCDATPTTAYDALHAAGFTTEGDSQDGPAFVCRIDGDPTPEQQSCTRTPPANAYWSMWFANAGQDSWSYSQSGAMDVHPRPGSVEAWVFGAGTANGGGAPTFSPEQVRAHNPPPAATPAPAPTRHHRTGAHPAAAPAQVPATPASRATPTAVPHRAPHRARHQAPVRAASSASPAVTAALAPPVTISSAPRAATSRTSGSPAGTVAGLLAVVAVAGAAVAVTVRRRRAS